MTNVEEYYYNCKNLNKVLGNELYLKGYFENENKKNLILKMSAYFENQFNLKMKELIEVTVNESLKEFFYKECFDRQFYKIFNFDIPTPRNGANSFFNKFGAVFSIKIKAQIKKMQLDQNIEHFILLVRERNLIIHTGQTNLINIYTLDELYINFIKAKSFLEFLFDSLITDLTI